MWRANHATTVAEDEAAEEEGLRPEVAAEKNPHEDEQERLHE
jgi:hypothetical protein